VDYRWFDTASLKQPSPGLRIGHRNESESTQLGASMDRNLADFGYWVGLLRTGAELAVFHPEEERDD